MLGWMSFFSSWGGEGEHATRTYERRGGGEAKCDRRRGLRWRAINRAVGERWSALMESDEALSERLEALFASEECAMSD